MLLPGLLLAMTAAIALAGAAEAETGLHSRSQGPVYRVSAVELAFAREHPSHPDLAELLATEFALGRTEDGLVGPRIGGDNAWFKLSELPLGSPVRLYASGLRELNEQLVEELNSRGLIGVYVAPHEDDIDPDTGTDRRGSRGALRLLIYTGRVAGLRSFVAGSDVESGVNTAKHARIRWGSPAQAGADGGPGSLLEKPELDAYLAYLNRHPGRRVDLAVTPTRDPGGVYLDYVVAEAKPWLAYAQFSNTGTRSTGTSRQRVGFTHFQLSGRDDVLRLDYVTGDLDQVHAGSVGYELPLLGVRRTRLELGASASRYEASELGFGDSAFEGRQWSFSSRITRTLLQREDWFLDAHAAVRWLDVSVENLGNRSDGEFVLPTLGLTVERRSELSSFRFGLEYERSVGSDISTARGGPDALLEFGGRSHLDPDWDLLRFDGSLSLYLEPVLWARSWRNVRTPKSSTLAHELALRLRGQLALGHRLIPQAQQTAGGFYSVRGYDQSVVSGDDVFVASAEYRLHLPRLLSIRPPRELPVLGTFRVGPERVYGRPDWDLILRLFVDGGRTGISSRRATESDNTLLSLGTGLELVVRQSLSLRYDFGYALRDVRVGSSERAEAGDTEHHVSATVKY